MLIGILGEYVARVYEEVKNRPLLPSQLDVRGFDRDLAGSHAVAPSQRLPQRKKVQE